MLHPATRCQYAAHFLRVAQTWEARGGGGEGQGALVTGQVWPRPENWLEMHSERDSRPGSNGGRTGNLFFLTSLPGHSDGILSICDPLPRGNRLLLTGHFNTALPRTGLQPVLLATLETCLVEETGSVAQPGGASARAQGKEKFTRQDTSLRCRAGRGEGITRKEKIRPPPRERLLQSEDGRGQRS